MAAKEIYAQIGESQDYSLLARLGTERAIGLAVKPGSGLLERGTIVMLGADGLYTPAATGKLTGALAVLAQDVETGSTNSGIAPSARAYSEGCFITGKMKLKEGALTQSDLLELRRQGLTSENMDGEVNNNVGG